MAAIYPNGTKAWYRAGVSHREGGQSTEYADGSKEWRRNGDLHRENGPAVEWPTATIWCCNGILHRDDGPAVVCASGIGKSPRPPDSDAARVYYLKSLLRPLEGGDYKAWCRDGLLHRDDGPAIEHADGTKEWYLYGKLHRDDGPAVEHPDGRAEWYRNGALMTSGEIASVEERSADIAKANMASGLPRAIAISPIRLKR